MPPDVLDTGAPVSGSDNELHTFKQNYLVRLFKGDVRLVITFWVWGFLVASLLATLPYLLDVWGAYVLSRSDFSLEWLRFVILFAFVFGLAYMIFVWIAIWRSAGNYQGRFWGTAARIWVSLSIASFLLDLLFPTEFPG